MAVEADAQRRRADRLIYLGDVGHQHDLFDALQTREIECTFGNWEVSGLRRLPPKLAEWVAEWPASIDQGSVRYSHATPDLPTAIRTTADAAAVVGRGTGWGELFPRLHVSDMARWAALAALETDHLRAAFHGHTHVQQAWCFSGGRWHSQYGPHEFYLEGGANGDGPRYLIGVGSAGDPQDGNALRYALYDDKDQSVALIELDTGVW